jgi:hypothetical protein
MPVGLCPFTKIKVKRGAQFANKGCQNSTVARIGVIETKRGFPGVELCVQSRTMAGTRHVSISWVCAWDRCVVRLYTHLETSSSRFSVRIGACST